MFGGNQIDGSLALDSASNRSDLPTVTDRSVSSGESFTGLGSVIDCGLTGRSDSSCPRRKDTESTGPLGEPAGIAETGTIGTIGAIDSIGEIGEIGEIGTIEGVGMMGTKAVTGTMSGGGGIGTLY